MRIPRVGLTFSWENIPPSDDKRLKRLGIEPPSDEKKVLYRIVRSLGFGPDWVGQKEGQYYLIEVKTNRAVLQKFQKNMMLKAKDFNFIPLIIRVKVNVKVLHEEVSVTVPLEEVRIEELASIP